MYVCLCAQVTDSQIRASGDLKALGVAQQCGACRELAEQIVKERDDTND